MISRTPNAQSDATIRDVLKSLVTPKRGAGAGVRIGMLRGGGGPCIGNQQVSKFQSSNVSKFQMLKVSKLQMCKFSKVSDIMFSTFACDTR